MWQPGSSGRCSYDFYFGADWRVKDSSNCPQKLDISVIALNMVKLLEDGLDFTEEKDLVKLVVEEVIAVPDQITIKGKIPVLDKQVFNKEKGDSNNGEYDIQFEKQKFFGEREVSLNVESRDCRIAECGEVDAV